MKKLTLILAVAAFTFTAADVVAQDKTAVQTEERSAENIQKEADALKARIDNYVEKVEANRSNDKVDYEAEQVRIKEMKAKWEALTGKDWEQMKKVEKL